MTKEEILEKLNNIRKKIEDTKKDSELIDLQQQMANLMITYLELLQK